MRSATALLAALLAAGCSGLRPAPAVVAAPADADPSALVAWGGGLAVAAGDAVRLVRGDRVVREVALPGRAYGLAAGADTLWAATAAGLVALPAPDAAPVPVALPLDGPGAVYGVAAGPDGRVWATTLSDGVYARTGGRWAREAQAFPVTGVVPQAGAVWVGTHQGVLRLAAAAAAPGPTPRRGRPSTGSTTT